MRLSIILALFAFTFPLFASDAGAMTFDQLNNKITAQGEKFKKEVKDITIRQTMTMEEDGQKMVQKMTMYKKGKKSRMESEMDMPGMGPMKSKSINDGKKQWVYSDLSGGWSEVPKDESYTVGPSDWWADEKRTGKVLGEETVGGRAGWKVLFKDHGESELVWFDKKGYFPLKTVNQSDGTESRFSDFRENAGFTWPYRMEIFQNGVKKGTMVIEKMKINGGLKDSLFTVPKDAGTKQPNLQEMMKRFGGMMKNGGED